MTPEQLKASILQYAIQGKLVEQRPEEGTAEELYRQIQEEKQKLIMEGKIKKEKPLAEIMEDEISFDIPESWKWIRLGDISESLNDGVHFAPKYIDNGVPCYSAKDIINDQIRSKNINYISEDDYYKLMEYKIQTQNGSILVTKSGSIGRSVVLDTWYKFGLVESVGVVNLILVNPYYVKRLLDYGFVYSGKFFDIYTNGIAVKHFTLKSLRNVLVPLPPLEEQHRIVAKIEELLPYVDRYAEAYEKLERFNAKFPEDMKKSILQYAIQGKLVEQRPEEGTAEELYQQIQDELKQLEKSKLFKVKDDSLIEEEEIPFDLPSSWKWLRLGQILNIESGKGLTAKQMKKGDIPVYGGNGVTGYHDEALIHKETVVIGRVGFYCGSVHVTPSEAWVTDNAFITTYPEKNIDRDYLVYVLRFLNLGQNSNATAQPVVSGKKIYPMLFPLPPLEEQKRIAARIEEILPICERLVK